MHRLTLTSDAGQRKARREHPSETRAQVVGRVPAHVVPRYDGALIVEQSATEALEKAIHHLGRGGRHDQSEPLTSRGTGDEQMHPRVALIAQAGRTVPAGPRFGRSGSAMRSHAMTASPRQTSAAVTASGGEFAAENGDGAGLPWMPLGRNIGSLPVAAADGKADADRHRKKVERH